jgi:hypothetical protein
MGLPGFVSRRLGLCLSMALLLLTLPGLSAATHPQGSLLRK